MDYLKEQSAFFTDRSFRFGGTVFCCSMIREIPAFHGHFLSTICVFFLKVEEMKTESNFFNNVDNLFNGDEDAALKRVMHDNTLRN